MKECGEKVVNRTVTDKIIDVCRGLYNVASSKDGRKMQQSSQSKYQGSRSDGTGTGRDRLCSDEKKTTYAKMSVRIKFKYGEDDLLDSMNVEKPMHI